MSKNNLKIEETKFYQNMLSKFSKAKTDEYIHLLNAKIVNINENYTKDVILKQLLSVDNTIILRCKKIGKSTLHSWLTLLADDLLKQSTNKPNNKVDIPTNNTINESTKTVKEPRLEYALPIGSVIAYCSTQIPEGFLPCIGGEVRKDEYPELYAVIGDSMGEAWFPETCFKLPDLQNAIIQGVSKQAEDHYKVGDIKTEIGDIKKPGLANGTDFYLHGTQEEQDIIEGGIYRTVQPSALCLMYIIKAK